MIVSYPISFKTCFHLQNIYFSCTFIDWHKSLVPSIFSQVFCTLLLTSQVFIVMFKLTGGINMSIGSRIKELRIKRNITQEELAKMIGVTKGAIANYENEISSPKIDLMYKLFDALDCDANYLHQDDMKKRTYKDKSTPEEFNKIIIKYRNLDDHGKKLVDTILDKEYIRCTCDYFIETQDGITFTIENKRSNSPTRSIDRFIEYSKALNAAHERTDIDVTEEMKKIDDDIMDN